MRKIECEVYTRVVGYFRPVKQMNAGKKSEVADRKNLLIRSVEEV